MRAVLAFASLCLLGACSGGEEQAQDAKSKNDPIIEHAQSLEKAADAQVKIIEREAQQQIDAVKAEDQATKATPEE